MTAPLRPPGAAREPRGTTVLLLLLLACLPYLIGLGEPPLWDANEPLYAEPPREALESGDWLAPSWNGKPWWVRPPLASWVTLPFYAVLGPTPFAERLPMALAALATILCVYELGRAAGGRRTGVMAALVLSATPRYWLFARQLAGDVYLVACLVGAFALALPALRDEARGRRRIFFAHALAGLGVLAKGPVILVLYAIPLVLTARLSRPRVPLRALRPLAGTLVVLAVAAPWFGYMWSRYGTEYLRVFFGWHHIRRAISEDVGGRPPWFYLVALLGDAQPWILLAPFAVLRRRRGGDRAAPTVLAWVGAAFPLVFFSIPLGKRNVYLLPLYPMLAAALAPFLLEIYDGLATTLSRCVAGTFAVVAEVASLLLVIGAFQVPGDISAGSRVYLVLALVTMGVAAAQCFRSAPGRAVVRLLVGTLLVAEIASALLLPILGRFMPVPQLARALVREARPEDAVIVYQSPIHSLMFYAERPTVVAHNEAELLAAIPEGGRAFVLGHEDAIAGLEKVPGLQRRTVASAPYFKFQFSWNVLGEGKSARELVLLEVTRATKAAGTK